MKTKSFDKSRPNCGGFFAGIGGFCIGFSKAGFNTVWASDIDERVAQTYRHNFGDVEFIQADIKNIDPNDFTPVDVLHAGFPCQSFSIAGNRQGFDDPRGQLFDVMMDKIIEMKKRPKILVFENSLNLLHGKNGLWFEHVKRRIKKTGYWFNTANALTISTHRHFGLPQKRDRVFLLATNRDYYDYNPFTYLPDEKERAKLLDFIRQDKVTDQAYYLDSENRYGEWLLREGGKMKRNELIQLRQHDVRKQKPDICPTLTANMGGGGHNVPFLKEGKRLRKLTERECLNLQGFPRTFDFPEGLPRGAKYTQIGNAVSPLVSEWLAKEIMHFLLEEASNVRMAV